MNLFQAPYQAIRKYNSNRIRWQMARSTALACLFLAVLVCTRPSPAYAQQDDGGGDAQGQNEGQKCGDQNPGLKGQPTTQATVPSFVNDLIAALTDKINGSNRLNVAVTVGGNFSTQAKTVCCDPNAQTAPANCTQYSGSGSLSVTVSIPLTPYSYGARSSITVPGVGSGYVFGKFTLGPVLTPAFTGSVSADGDDSQCGCLHATGGFDGTVTLSGTASGSAGAKLYVNPGNAFAHPYGLFANAALSGTVSGSTGATATGDYRKGSGANCTPQGLSNFHGSIGGFKISASLEAELSLRVPVFGVTLPVSAVPLDKTVTWTVFTPWYF